MPGSRSRKLRNQLQALLLKERFGEALDCYRQLERMEADEPRWPHRRGDLLKRLGRLEEAVDSYERAVDLYAKLGFVARAAAMAKVVMAIDPDRTDVLERVAPEPARKLHRSARGAVVTADSDQDLEPSERTQTKRISTEAFPLVQTKGPGDMLRFTQPPTATHLELDISEIELADRPAPSPGRLSERPPAEHLAQLPSMPLFAEVPRTVLGRIIRESSLVDLDPGEMLIERGTPADALYALIEGSVQLIRDQDKDAVVLSEGDVVGVSCLLNRVSYEGDVTASTPVRALRIAKDLLDSLVAECPALGDILLEVLGRRLVATLVRTSPMFSSFENGARAEVAAMFGARRAQMGTTILEAGKRADGLYIPMIGELTAVDANGEEAGSLKLGRALGQHSMLTGTPSTMTVRAASDVLLLRLSARRFNALVAKHPRMVAHLEELARRPSAPAFSLVPPPRTKKRA
ncbi:MAG: cyclic nucleotide-binding domain-containing protein [Polyangiales bacterium]